MSVDLSKYEVIYFRNKSTNISQKQQCIKIGKYLGVAYNHKEGNFFKVFKIKQGIPLLDVKFASMEDAIKFAEWINDVFSDYFVLWDEYPNADVFSLVKWTVPDGLRMYEMVQLMSKRHKASVETLAKDYNDALSKAQKKWLKYEQLAG